MTELDAVRAYRDAWLRSQSLHGHAVVAAADAAIAALLARVEELSNQREQSHAAFHIQKVRADRAEEVIRTLEMMLAAAEERLRVCGTCTHQDIDVDDDGGDYKMLRLADEDVVSVANRGSAEAQRCDTCAHCAECDIQQMLSPFIEDWGDTFCSSWTDRKQEP